MNIGTGSFRGTSRKHSSQSVHVICRRKLLMARNRIN